MGNKHDLAADVVRLAQETARDAPLVDLFCGMCSIGQAFASTGRPVWGNDVQAYAGLAARCHLTSTAAPLRSPELAGKLHSYFRDNASLLRERFCEAVRQEALILHSHDGSRYAAAHDAWRHTGNDADIAAEVSDLAAGRVDGPHRLVTLTFAWGYFGVAQAIALDSIRYAIDAARRDRVLTRGRE
jgi:hypothetical protein